MRRSIDKAGLKVKLHDGMSIMIGGFLADGTPKRIVDVLVECGIRDPTMIVNDTSYPNRGCDRLIVNKQIKHLIVPHIGTNPTTAEQISNGELGVEFSPQGTLAERIRVGGCGLGGILTTTGLGIITAESKKVTNISGQGYLLELPLRVDMVFTRGTAGDGTGSLIYKGTTQNLRSPMAMAADCIIAEIDKLVPVRQISPKAVHTSGISVDYIFE